MNAVHDMKRGIARRFNQVKPTRWPFGVVRSRGHLRFILGASNRRLEQRLIFDLSLCCACFQPAGNSSKRFRHQIDAAAMRALESLPMSAS